MTPLVVDTLAELFSLLKIILPIITTAGTGLAVWKVQENAKQRDARDAEARAEHRDTISLLIDNNDKLDKALSLTTEATKASHRIRMTDIHHRAIDRGSISQLDRESFNEAYASYRSLGGNGTMCWYAGDIEKLPVNKD